MLERVPEDTELPTASRRMPWAPHIHTKGTRRTRVRDVFRDASCRRFRLNTDGDRRPCVRVVGARSVVHYERNTLTFARAMGSTPGSPGNSHRRLPVSLLPGRAWSAPLRHSRRRRRCHHVDLGRRHCTDSLRCHVPWTRQRDQVTWTRRRHQQRVPRGVHCKHLDPRVHVVVRTTVDLLLQS